MEIQDSNSNHKVSSKPDIENGKKDLKIIDIPLNEQLEGDGIPSSEELSSPNPSSSANKPDDHWVKLSHLKQLYEQGFITITEYKDRKSQIVDVITGTKSKSGTSSQSTFSSQQMYIRQEYVPPREPKFEGTTPEKAIKYIFDPKTGEWSHKTIFIQMEKEPFAKGGLRKAYYLKYQNPEDAQDSETTNINSNQVYVAKMSDDHGEREIYLADVEMQMFAREWAKKYNAHKPPKQIEFIKAVVLELVERESKPLCGVEKFIDGPYVRYYEYLVCILICFFFSFLPAQTQQQLWICFGG